MAQQQGQAVRVLHSLDAVRDTTNPYLVLLIRSLPAEVESQLFSWRTAVFGQYDVIHVNSELSDQASDHDPQVVRLTVNLG